MGTQLYSVFLIKTNSTDGAVFLFQFKQDPLLRPGVGDVLTNPFTFGQFKIIRDESVTAEVIIRITDNGDTRFTDNGDRRVVQVGIDPASVTHQYFVTPANNPNRITSYTTIGFENDQTLKQLFK